MNLVSIWRNLSLGSKLGVLMSVLALSTVLLATSFSTQREQEYFHTTLVNQADLLLTTTSLNIRDPLYRLQLDELNEVTDSIRDNPEITFIIIYDSKGRILSESNQTKAIYSQIVDPLGAMLVSLSPEQNLMQWGKNELVAGRAVVVGKHTIGAIAIGFSTKNLDEQVLSATRQNLVIAFSTVLFGSLLAFLLARQVTNPVRDLANVATRMAEGDLSSRVKLKANDEIGKLGEIFNQMADAIQQREQELRNLTKNLEQEVSERTASLREQAKILEQMAITDPLTKIFNRRHFFELAELEVQRAKRYGHPLALIVIDADYFKNINDTFGHPIGDQVLISLTELCQKNIRSVDIFGRYGGEEFILLLPEIENKAAYEMAERLRKIISESVLEIEGNKVSLTISMGVSWSGEKQEANLSTLVSGADQALYQSKQSGRNLVTMWKTE